MNSYKYTNFIKNEDFSGSPEELKQFWVDHHTEVYNLLLFKFTEFDDVSKKGKASSFIHSLIHSLIY